MAGTSNWREVRGEWTVNEARVERFRSLMDAQQRIAAALAPHGVTDAQIDAALAHAEAALPTEDRDQRDFRLSALELYVTSLGGRIELDPQGARAVFAAVTVVIDPLGSTLGLIE